jgi:hypothetical protein
MCKKITSGPFFVPLFLDGTSPLPVDYLLIGFKNLSNCESTVHVVVRVCNDTRLYPPFTPPEVTIYHEIVKMPAGTCAVLRLDAGKDTFQGNNMLRVIVEGDVYEDGKGVLVGLSGGSNGRSTVSMVFKHADFIELE